MRTTIKLYTSLLLVIFLSACDNQVTQWSYTDSRNAADQRKIASLIHLDDDNQAYVSGVEFKQSEQEDQVEQSIFIKKISESNLVWERKITSTINGGINDIHVSWAFNHLVAFDPTLEDYYFAASRFYTLDDLQSRRTHEIVLVKVNKTGDLLWHRVIAKDAEEDDFPKDLSFSEGILTLAFNREEGFVRGSTWVMQFDTDGNPVNELHLEDSHLDFAALNHNGVSLLAANIELPTLHRGIRYVGVGPMLNILWESELIDRSSSEYQLPNVLDIYPDSDGTFLVAAQHIYREDISTASSVTKMGDNMATMGDNMTTSRKDDDSFVTPSTLFPPPTLIHVLRLSPDGSKLWEITIDKWIYDYLLDPLKQSIEWVFRSATIKVFDGNIYLATNPIIFNVDHTIDIPTMQFDAALYKLSPHGEIQWSQRTHVYNEWFRDTEDIYEGDYRGYTTGPLTLSKSGKSMLTLHRDIDDGTGAEPTANATYTNIFNSSGRRTSRLSHGDDASVPSTSVNASGHLAIVSNNVGTREGSMASEPTEWTITMYSGI